MVFGQCDARGQRRSFLEALEGPGQGPSRNTDPSLRCATTSVQHQPGCLLANAAVETEGIDADLSRPSHMAARSARGVFAGDVGVRLRVSQVSQVKVPNTFEYAVPLHIIFFAIVLEGHQAHPAHYGFPCSFPSELP